MKIDIFKVAKALVKSISGSTATVQTLDRTVQASLLHPSNFVSNPTGKWCPSFQINQNGEQLVINAVYTTIEVQPDEVRIFNKNNFIKLLPDGTIEFKGITIDTEGVIICKDVITASGISLEKHVHIGNLGFTTSEPTLIAPPVPSNPPSADSSGVVSIPAGSVIEDIDFGTHVHPDPQGGFTGVPQ